MEKNIIYNGDCIEGMKILPDNSVDMVLTDPPYGTTQNKWTRLLMWMRSGRKLRG